MNQTLPILIRALSGEKTERVPIWYMRQAGRYLPEYNEIRKGHTFLELTQNPELSAEISIQPHKRFELDGIIMFADILTPIHGAGVRMHFEEKKGPVLEDTIQSEGDLKLLDSFTPEKDTAYVSELIHRINGYIDTLPVHKKPGLLGFAGAPFTLASYLLEGGTSKKFEKTKGVLFQNTDLFHRISDRLADMTIDYLVMQIESGVQAIQIFDSWGGILSQDHYRIHSAPFIKKIIDGVREKASRKVPIIAFTGTSQHLLEALNELQSDAISLDWRVKKEDVERFIPSSKAIQGNMDPLLLYGTVDSTIQETKAVLANYSNREGGYVFNLGHGIHPGSSLDCVQAMVNTVRSYKS